jgi:hypothetical protein
MHEGVWRDNKLGISTVHVVAGEACRVAEVLLILLTEVALAAGREEPGDAEAIAYPETRHPFPNPVHDPDDLVAWDERKLRKR